MNAIVRVGEDEAEVQAGIKLKHLVRALDEHGKAVINLGVLVALVHLCYMYIFIVYFLIFYLFFIYVFNYLFLYLFILFIYLFIN